MKAIFDWHEMKESEMLYLSENAINFMVDKGVNKTGSLSRLCQKINSNQLYRIIKKNGGISVKILKKLLQYCDIEYNLINNEIIEIRKGNIPSIRKPKFPIDLLNPTIGYLLGHIVSDGCLYFDNSRENLIRTKYCGDDQEGITLFLSAITDIFGEVHYNKEFIRNCHQIRIGNGVVGEVLRLAGAPVGKKYKLNEGLPLAVEKGDIEIKRQYLKAIFDDEGSIGIARHKFPYLILSRNIHLKITTEERYILSKYILPLMKTRFFPTGHSAGIIPIRLLRKILMQEHADGLLRKIELSKPKLLIDESVLLINYFGITNQTYVIALHLTNNGYLSLQSCLVIRKKQDVLKYYKEIGFSFMKKQNKLKEAIVNHSLIKRDHQIIQHPEQER